MKHARSPAIVSSSPILSLIFVFRRTYKRKEIESEDAVKTQK